MKNENSSPAFIVAPITVDLLLVLYTIIRVAIRFFSTKVYYDIFFDKLLDNDLRPQFVIGIIANGIMIFILLALLVCFWISEKIDQVS